MNAVIYADYIEYEPDTYKGCYVYNEAEDNTRFKTGSFELDLELAEQDAYKLGFAKIIYSSSVDHYLMDSGELS